MQRRTKVVGYFLLGALMLLMMAFGFVRDWVWIAWLIDQGFYGKVAIGIFLLVGIPGFIWYLRLLRRG